MRKSSTTSNYQIMQQIEEEYKLFLRNLLLLSKEQAQLISEYQKKLEEIKTNELRSHLL